MERMSAATTPTSSEFDRVVLTIFSPISPYPFHSSSGISLSVSLSIFAAWISSGIPSRSPFLRAMGIYDHPSSEVPRDIAL